jgi:hypothetical protein
MKAISKLLPFIAKEWKSMTVDLCPYTG